jgi:L-cysteate sulfo-lyase
MNLDKFPRLRVAHLPTPFEPLPRLSRTLGGPNLYIKRDDCTGLAMGGNKARKLDYLMADALAKRATVVVTQGAVQSNHVRQTAAIAAQLGLACHVLLEDRTGRQDVSYCHSGNVILDQLFGAQVSTVPGGTDMKTALEGLAGTLRDAGERVYVIPGGGSNALGALGYVECASELMSQIDAAGISVNHIVLATGSAGTQAGLVAGLQAHDRPVPVLGISVRWPREKQRAAVTSIAVEVADLLASSNSLSPEAVVVTDEYVGPGYGVATHEVLSAVALVARTEGILLDPVYTGKAMSGLIDLIRRGHFAAGENVVFLHTGGSAGLFGYLPDLIEELSAKSENASVGRAKSEMPIAETILIP